MRFSDIDISQGGSQLDTDRQVQSFKGTLRLLLSDERLMHGGNSDEALIIDRCSGTGYRVVPKTL